jgi:hypothetical protein
MNLNLARVIHGNEVQYSTIFFSANNMRYIIELRKKSQMETGIQGIPLWSYSTKADPPFKGFVYPKNATTWLLLPELPTGKKDLL